MKTVFRFVAGLGFVLPVLAAMPLPLAAAPVPFTDSDGDSYTVTLSGGGTVQVTMDDPDANQQGPIATIALTGTKPGSGLSVKVKKGATGDGKVSIGAITADAAFGSVNAAQSDLVGAGVTVAGVVKTLKLANIADGAAITLGMAAKLTPLKLTAGAIGDATLNTPGSTLALVALSVGPGAEFSAAQAATLKTTAGAFAGEVRIAGKMIGLLVTGGNFTGRVQAAAINSISVKRNRAGVGGSIIDSTIAAGGAIGAVMLDGDLVNSQILAGANLGADGKVGGIGADADTFAAAALRTVSVKGSVSDSVIGAGFTPVDGVFGDLNDGAIGGKLSKLSSFTVKGTLADSLVGAGLLPKTVSVNKVRFTTATNPQFISRVVIVPPNPVMIAKPLDPTRQQPAAVATDFLFTGPNAVQTGVAPGTIEPARAAVLRGRVLNRDEVPLAGVRVTVLDRAEFGQTFTRSDGLFDLAINGGSKLVVRFDANGFTSVHRQVDPATQDFEVLGDVMLVAADSAMTEIALGAGAPMQMHAATMQSDASGDRQAKLMFQPDTSASLVMADGSTAPMTSLRIRATEFTVGPNGPAAMPGTLPSNSAYTYCVDLTADEASNAGATTVTFDKPVYLYVDNFLNFEGGIDVPSGFYNKAKGVWEAGPSGKIIKVVSMTAGAADLDVTGDGNADTGAALTALNITDAERIQLASSYAVGATFWRVPIPHFSPWDCNWPFGPPPDAEPPNGGPPSSDDPPDDCDDPPNIYLQSQVVGERVSLAGIPYGLNYRSDRMPGRSANQAITIPLSGATIPASLKRIDASVDVGGRTFLLPSSAPATNARTSFQWDGLDGYERPVYGRQPATVRVSFVYDGSYQRTTRFASNGNGVAITGDRTRQEIMLSTTNTVMVGGFDLRKQAVGGWTLDVHHAYDPAGRVLYHGDGTRRSVESIARVIETISGAATPGFSGDGGPAKLAQLNGPSGVAVGPDGCLYIADFNNHRIRKIDRNGIISTYAGTGVNGFSGDGGPAINAQLQVAHIRFGADGSLYCSVGDSRIRKIDPRGIITTVAGTSVFGSSGDDGPALNATLNNPAAVPAADGTIYFAEISPSRVRAVKPDGTVIRIAGYGGGGDGSVAVNAALNSPTDLALGPDDSVWIGDTFSNRLRRVGPDGIITTVAGGGNPPVGNGDGGPATEARINLTASISGTEMAHDAQGNVYFTERANGVIRCVNSAGIISTVAGSGIPGLAGDGGPATAARISPAGFAVAPDGSIYITDGGRVRRVGAPLPGFSGGELAVPSEDGTELYRFDATGRHLSTVHTFTGATIYRFDYDSNGQLVKITDGAGNATTIQRTSSGTPMAIIGPSGHRTTLTVDAEGTLTRIEDPLGGAWQFGYQVGGLLTSETDPVGNHHTFTYDAGGLVTQGDHAGPAAVQLARTGIPNGYMVQTTSALGATGTYKVENPPNGSEVRTNVASTGLTATQTQTAQGGITATTPDGTISAQTLGPDPRFGMQAPLQSVDRLTTPGGKVITLSTARTAALADSDNPLSLTAFTETLSLNGAVFTTTYDLATQTFLNTSPTGRTSSITIDDLGRATTIQAGISNARKLTYDARSHLTSETIGTGNEARSTKYAYGGDGNLTAITDPLNRKWTFAYDAAGRVAQRKHPDGGVVAIGYDAAGNVTSIAPPGRPAHLLTFGPNGYISSYTAPDAGSGPAVTTFGYNAHDALVQVARPGGETIAYGYDTGGRLSTRTIAAGTTTFAYHPTTGALATITMPGGDAVAHTYDGAFELSTTWTGAVAGSVTRTLDSNARTATQSVNGAGAVSYGYDADWLLTSVGPLTLARDGQRGIVASTTLGSVMDARSFNGFGEITGYTANHGGTPLISLQHSYDKNGRLTQIVETVGAAAAETFAYAYDAVGRLIEVRKNAVVQDTFTYDANGNRLTAGGVGSSYDAQDRLTTAGTTTFTYKASGDLVSKTTGGATTQYTYDELGNLTAVALPGGLQIDYVIDGHNRRIGRKLNGTLDRGFLYQDALNIVGELDGAGQLVSRFVYADRDDVPAFMFKGGVTYRLLADWLGSVRLVVNTATGAIAQRLDYDAFGKVLLDTSPGFQPFGFAGGLYDPDTGLVRFGARDYDPAVGRWTTKDPLVFAGRETNLYAYAENDPVNRFDPEGLDTVSIGFYQAAIVPGHATVSVNGSPFQGFYPDNGGKIVNEGQQLKRNPDYRIRFKITPDQARRIKKYIEDQKKKGRNYDIFADNCAHFVRDALEAGGVVRNGRGYAYSPSQLFRELLFGGGNFTF